MPARPCLSAFVRVACDILPLWVLGCCNAHALSSCKLWWWRGRWAGAIHRLYLCIFIALACFGRRRDLLQQQRVKIDGGFGASLHLDIARRSRRKAMPELTKHALHNTWELCKFKLGKSEGAARPFPNGLAGVRGALSGPSTLGHASPAHCQGFKVPSCCAAWLPAPKRRNRGSILAMDDFLRAWFCFLCILLSLGIFSARKEWLFDC